MTFESFRSENELFGWAVFEELKRLGLEHVFIAPGSRSTPLVLGSHAHKELKKTVHFDERGLGFAALGVAKATHRPVVIITTSGTAVSNLLPAVTEAHYSGAPLIIMSADRPFELRETGANQAIDQVKLFQSVVRDQFDIPAPSGETQYNSIFSTLSYAYSQSSNGPVHLNFMFREPLAPPNNGKFTRNFNFLQQWQQTNRPHVTYASTSSVHYDQFIPLFSSGQKVLIVAGEGLTEEDQTQILELSSKIAAPVLPDIISGLRFKNLHPNIINFAELVSEAKLPTPDVLIHFGGPLQSKRLNEYCNQLICHKFWISIEAKRQDYQHQSKTIVQSHPSVVASFLIKNNISADKNFAAAFRELNTMADTFLINTFANTSAQISEPQVAYILSQINKPELTLYSGSSRPIRDFERFGAPSKNKFNFYANRGTSGIDGNIATFFGLSFASKTLAVGLIGDLAFLHDANSLALFRQITRPTILVVINNNGGGIFSFLPVNEHSESFEKYFGAPHGLEVSSIAKSFGVSCLSAKTSKDLELAIDQAQLHDGLTVIEILTSREDNLILHKSINSQWKETLQA